ncbi:PREDICTED: thioredoxin reductase 1, cytoplasmic-like [Priapulus caudatus]|uniref:Thioredoxin reductase 1, cytoplasmic-like n=1 Tax=Priapulus caudatus TaxID=37621 RepID=A0ABM1ENT6_PRICU|nr:PREDICTED: thioredoxin reductase 1, cytoplasmic-like [Priapulus caudatus]
MIMPPTQQYDYDLCVIGGGSGGLAAAKQAAKLGKKVVLLDFVKPSPKGTTWGLGGTCVNVGCIPKKLMHQASLLGESLVDAKHFGWQVNKSEVAHNWQEMTEAVQNHIGSVNWNYRVQLRTKEVTYVNGYGEFVDDHTVKAIGRRNKETIITAERFVLAMGMRPRYDNIPGVKECSITSDDLFSLPYSPGKTLCVGASYVSLECAGFLAGLGMDVTVMVRSILLRGFDQQMAEKVGAYMENHGVKFIRGAVPTKLEQIEEGQPGVIRVHAKTTDGEDIVGDYNTVLYAIGRDACTTELGLEKLNVQLNPKNKKIVCNDADQSSVSHIYAIGDILDGRPELTPVAVQAGKLLAKRLFGGSTVLTDYVNVATTVFTPLEYGACGYSEEDAIDKFGAESIEVYHVNFWPLEFTVAQKSEKDCYAKLICNKLDSLRVVGLHILGPNAGEITQGYSVAIKMGATKDDFDTTIGIHPTVAEVFTTMEITKGSGEPFATAGC